MGDVPFYAKIRRILTYPLQNADFQFIFACIASAVTPSYQISEQSHNAWMSYIDSSIWLGTFFSRGSTIFSDKWTEVYEVCIGRLSTLQEFVFEIRYCSVSKCRQLGGDGSRKSRPNFGLIHAFKTWDR